jgi:hypothetical protein
MLLRNILWRYISRFHSKEPIPTSERCSPLRPGPIVQPLLCAGQYHGAPLGQRQDPSEARLPKRRPTGLLCPAHGGGAVFCRHQGHLPDQHGAGLVPDDGPSQEPGHVDGGRGGDQPAPLGRLPGPRGRSGRSCGCGTTSPHPSPTSQRVTRARLPIRPDRGPPTPTPTRQVLGLQSDLCPPARRPTARHNQLIQ